MNKIKRCMATLTIMLLAIMLLLPTVVCARDAIDLDKKGSISITVANKEGEPVNGVEVSIYKVADVATDPTTGYKLVLTEAFADGGFDFDKVTDESSKAALADDLKNYVARNNLSGEKKKSDSNGNVLWDNLDLGVYFLMNTVATDRYTQVSSFCVTLPNLVDDTYYYDVQARPKSVVITDIPVPPPPPPPPKTGQLWWPVPVLVCLGLACVIVGIMMKKKRNVDAER